MGDVVTLPVVRVERYRPKAAWRERRYETILDAYILSGITGRPFEQEREELFRKRDLGTIDD